MMDKWEDTIATYSLSIGLQFGFQTFANSRKVRRGEVLTPMEQDGAEAQCHPSTVFLATHTLAAALLDVASRSSVVAAPGVPAGLAGLACAVRELHGTIFQPYGTWLKAVKLRPPRRPSHPLPNQDSLHFELADLALYWLVHTEAANLRHTPEMIWFIFFCAQRSRQAKQVLDHLKQNQTAMRELARQPWLAEMGPGLVRAVQSLHDKYRRGPAGGKGELGGDRGEGLSVEATLRIPGDLYTCDAVVEGVAFPQLNGGSAATAVVDADALSPDTQRVAVAVAGAEGCVSIPCEKPCGERWGSYLAGVRGDEARTVNGEGSGAVCVGGLRQAHAAATVTAPSGSVRGRRHGGLPESPSLPLPPSISAPAPTDTGAPWSAFAVPGAAAVAIAAAVDMAAAAPLHQRNQPHAQLCGRTPKSPAWDPRVAPEGYRELLLRFCPDEAAVAAALEAEGGSGDGDVRAGTQFLERIVQPLFLFLTEQVYELGQARRQGLEAAVRIGYDDVSESMAHPLVVEAALKALAWASTIAANGSSAAVTGPACKELLQQMQQRRHVQGQWQQQQQQQTSQPQPLRSRAASHDEELYWSRLLALSDLPPPGSARIPWQGDMACHQKQLLQLLQGGDECEGGAAGRGPSGGGAGSAGSRDCGMAARRPLGPSGPQFISNRAGGASSADDQDGGDEEAPNLTLEQMAKSTCFAASQPPGPEARAELGRLRRANAATDWWARHVLRKTFVEHRSIAMPLIAFGRVFQFQLLWFYLLAVWSWTDDGDRMHWIASAAALHWGSNCLLWSMQEVLSSRPRMKHGGMVIPAYDTRQGRPRRDRGPAAPYSLYALQYRVVQLYFLAVAWGALGAGIYIAYIVWPKQSFYGHVCYPLFWGRSCYWWIAVVYGGALMVYEMIYRQLNLGGYVRGHVYDILLRLVPGQGTASASTSDNPLYDPARHLRTGLSYLLGNTALWAATLGFKFVIDYFVIVQPAGPQLREVLNINKLAWSFDIPRSWSWWPSGWSRHFTVDLDPCMAAAQVIVLFLLSLVSSGVAYTVVTALWGAIQGVHQGVGSIRHWDHIRSGFHRVQAALRDKLLTSGRPSNDSGHVGRSCFGRAIEGLCRAFAAVLLLPYTCAVWILRGLCCLPPPSKGGPRSWVEREETLGMTAPFWNAIVRSLRGRDLLSDREAAALSFTAVSFSPAAMMATWRRGRGRAGSDGGVPRGRETYLPPVAVYVAQLPQLVISGSRPSAEQLEQLQEAYLYLLHLLVAIRAIPRSAEAAAEAVGTDKNGIPLRGSCCEVAATATSSSVCPGLHKDSFHPDKFADMAPCSRTHRGLVGRRELLGAVLGLVKALVETGKVFKDTTAAANAAAAVSRRGRAIDKLCMALHGVARCAAQVHDMPWEMATIMGRVVSRQHFHQPAVKLELHRGFSALVAPNRNNATTWGAEHMPSYDDFAKVSSWLVAILKPTDEGTAPSNPEAVALLADFCSGLMHPGLPRAPRVEAMRSVSTLIPHYHETVLYALSSADARRVLREAGATSLEGNLADDEVLFKDDDGTLSELLQYLVSEFPDEFRNLLERCRTIVPLNKDEPPYTLEDFLPLGRLYAHRAQLLLWASCRGQVLARTVDGMHMYRTALAMQAVHDAMMEAGGYCGSLGPAQRKQSPGNEQEGKGRLKLSGVQQMLVQGILKDDSLAVEELVAQLVDVVQELGPLLERKYGLVVASQVFSKMSASRSLADRWRAHGISLLATRYSAMRVAFLEQDGDPITIFKAPDFSYRVVHQASVLMRAMPLEREVEARRKAKAEKHAATEAADEAAAASAVELTPQAALCSPAITTMYGTGQEGVGAITPRSVTPPASWVDAISVTGDGVSNAGSNSDWGGCSGDDEGSEDAGAALRVWRRRFQLKHLRAADLEVLFRQRLPINYYDRNAAGVGVILGEGKPENQNSAMPYCPGVLLQTIDMNQDNSLAQALKLRNATLEFEPLGPGRQQQHVAVVGYPEWIFSYRCGLLADLAAATERTFGTQIQRVMGYPSAVRAHYGHPDFWNRLFTMTRGGLSKANAVQHVSEDVFGGYNALKRGGLSKYVSYISVGKGRDMGLDSILGFEGKISKGGAEQLMSRDLRFLGAHTDFFRSMSLYFTVPGHFINTWITVVTIQLGVWVQLLLLLGGVGRTGSSVASAVGAVQVLQLGTMPMLGYLFNVWLESGMAAALATIARQFVGGGLLFHIFRSVTSAFHLGRAVLFGGASYVATGRGFSLHRKTFTQVYVNYGRSHLYLGADILLMVVLILVVGNNGGNKLPVPAAAMWSPILVSAALLAGPFWFTPFFFRLSEVVRDLREFRSWISSGSAARGVSESWAEWNASQLATLRDDAGGQVPRYRLWSTLALVAPRTAISVLSAVVTISGARFDTPFLPDWVWVLGGSGAAWLLIAAMVVTRRAYLTSGLAVGWRWARGMTEVAALGAFVVLVAVCLFAEKRGLRFSGVLVTLYANYSVVSLLVCVLVMWMPKFYLARSISNAAYRHADAVLGTALSAVLIVICFIGEIGLIMVDKVQTLVQFNDRYSHTQAARPYGGDDALATGGGGSGGGGGLRAAAADALRRRPPGHLVMMAPRLTPSCRGSAATAVGTGTGSRRVTGGGASVQASGSRAPSAMGGWVSPRFRDGGASPFSSFTAGSTTVETVAAATPPEYSPSVTRGHSMTPGINSGGGAAAASVTTRSYTNTAVRKHAVGATVQPPAAMVARASGVAATAVAAGIPATASRFLSCSSNTTVAAPWKSAALAASGNATASNGGVPSSSGGAAATAAQLTSGSGALPGTRSSRCVSCATLAYPSGVGTVSTRARLPPADEWRGVTTAAASAGVSRVASQQPQAPPSPSLQQQQQQQHESQAIPPWTACTVAKSRAEAAQDGGSRIATPPAHWAALGPVAGVYGGRAASPNPRHGSPTSQRAVSPVGMPATTAVMPGCVRAPLRQQSMCLAGSPRDAVADPTAGRVSDIRRSARGCPGRVPGGGLGGGRSPQCGTLGTGSIAASSAAGPAAAVDAGGAPGADSSF